MVKKINLGLIGLSEGNGHPYSFSAIINGYDKQAMQKSGWSVIYNYLLKCDKQDFLNRDDVAITHLYTQDKLISENLSRACKIPHIVNSLEELALAPIDGVILARDDWEHHKAMAKPFLESNKFVFIDKPLSLEKQDIAYFTPFLQSRKLMSCSGMRYARELDSVRKALQEDGESILFIEASIGSAWDKYFIHLIDAIMGLTPFRARHIEVMKLDFCVSALIQTQSFTIQLNNINASFQPCTLAITTDKNRYTITLSDNFSAFRRTMGHFIAFMEGESFDYQSTLEAMNILSQIKAKLEKVGNLAGGGDKLNSFVDSPTFFTPHFYKDYFSQIPVSQRPFIPISKVSISFAYPLAEVA